MRNKQDRERAKKLRLRGKSYGEISKTLGIPKSTLYTWLRGLELSDITRSNIDKRVYKKSVQALIKRNKQQTAIAQRRARYNRTVGASKIKQLSQKDFLIAGATLYWAEGYKKTVVRNGRKVTHHVVSLTNSDVDLIKLFLKFLREYHGVPNDKIRANLRLFKHQNEEQLKKYWALETGIDQNNFNKTYYGESISSQRKRPFNRLPYGVLQVSVGSTELFHKIMGHIEGLKKLV